MVYQFVSGGADLFGTRQYFGSSDIPIKSDKEGSVHAMARGKKQRLVIANEEPQGCGTADEFRGSPAAALPLLLQPLCPNNEEKDAVFRSSSMPTCVPVITGG